MVFVDTKAVESEALGVLQLVEVVVVEFVALGWVKEVVGDVDPYAAVLLLKVGGEELIGHQVEKAQFHGGVPPSGVGWVRLVGFYTVEGEGARGVGREACEVFGAGDGDRTHDS